VAPAARLGTATAPFVATSPAPCVPKVQIQLHLASISVRRCVRGEVDACCLLLFADVADALRMQLMLTVICLLPLLLAFSCLCTLVADPPHQSN
jgi:hypothetical protein